ncbi:hypothetical protein [Candidatus Entotheonella palauensis]|uniref:Deoxyhypusine synthase n=1 Tax=Candidatus Entotheonella gemina TaxID=1429439 RepID=W4MCN6_9BACT|nr:hypothetical protein [Candidatus Entotheonella palauensis]ETX07968.1 MAG: hypothetical protein ETSY2_08200 [Candidatus Entotheonella gemina]
MKADEVETLQRVETYSIRERQHKVSIPDFIDPAAWQREHSLRALFPSVLKGQDITAIVDDFVAAQRRGRSCLIAMGAHVIKCGLNPLLIDMMRRGWLQGLVLNGAGVIHDLEVALIGATSEDVAQNLGTGAFGMVEETPLLINAALKQYDSAQNGMGLALGQAVAEGDYPYQDYSLLASAYRHGVPVTVHVAIGADTIHMHPTTDAALLGQATYRDFQRLTLLLRGLHDGGCYWNIGSAVILPEVFLKALTLCRNTGHAVERFTTVNLDMLQHYRPEFNVIRRPTQDGGRGYALTGHHEIMLPLLYALIVEVMDRG